VGDSASYLLLSLRGDQSYFFAISQSQFGESG
jgi:hypothetical protein